MFHGFGKTLFFLPGSNMLLFARFGECFFQHFPRLLSAAPTTGFELP
jgi:hypothetical protein